LALALFVCRCCLSARRSLAAAPARQADTRRVLLDTCACTHYLVFKEPDLPSPCGFGLAPQQSAELAGFRGTF